MADGVQRERSTHYHLLVLRSFLGAWENARRFGVALPAGFTDGVERAAEFARWVHRPDGQIPALSDADNGAYLDLLALAARLAGRPELGPAAAPAGTSRAFPDGGYHVQRSGWGPDAHHLVFDCGPLGDGGHGHYDQLSVEVSLAGRAVLVDPGRFTYADTAERRGFKSTAAHNTVTVDGLDQSPYRRGKPKGPLPQARLLRTHAEPGLEVLTGQATSPCYDAVHTREVAFVARRLWVVVDRLEAPGPHRYEQRWHLAPEALGALRLDGASAVAPGVALTVAGADSLQVEDGWASPRYGVRQPAPVVAAVAHGAVVELVTVIAEAPAALVVRRLDPDAVELTLDAAEVGWERR
ncbi:MAG: alginate lyase family protein [Acidimicrobiales bacterium]